MLREGPIPRFIHGLLEYGAGGLLIVVPGASGERRAVLEVAGCRGYLGARVGSGAALEAVSG